MSNLDWVAAFDRDLPQGPKPSAGGRVDNPLTVWREGGMFRFHESVCSESCLAGAILAGPPKMESAVAIGSINKVLPIRRRNRIALNIVVFGDCPELSGC